MLWFPGNIKVVFKTRAWDSNENSVDLKSQPDWRGVWQHHFIPSCSCASQHTVLSQVGVKVLWSERVKVPWNQGLELVSAGCELSAYRVLLPFPLLPQAEVW